jgi:hypothetical protein
VLCVAVLEDRHEEVLSVLGASFLAVLEDREEEMLRVAVVVGAQ